MTSSTHAIEGIVIQRRLSTEKREWNEVSTGSEVDLDI